MNYCDVFYYKVDNIAYPEGVGEPSERYPELEDLGYMRYSEKKNEVYEAVRTILFELGYDKENYNTSNWNPLKNVIKKHQKVLLKPNMVFHEHPYGEEAVISMVTNYSILRPLIDYIILATEGEVEIIIGDCPVQTAIFSEVSRISGIEKLYNFYKELGYNIKLIDMRMLITKINRQGIKEKRTKNPLRKESDYITVDLKEKSALMPIIEKANRLEITDYKKGSVNRHHNNNKNEYVVPREVLEADLIINVPKLKTHRKAGMTCAMKNLVGINGDKTCIAHHMRGTKSNGGDEFNEFNMKEWGKVRIWSFLKSTSIGIKIAGIIKTFFQKYIWKGKTLKEHNMQVKPQYFSEGSWYGNDTIWRCVKDLNRIILYADKNGQMKEQVQRNYLCIVDAILAGEGEGPMEQTEKRFGVIFGGNNPVYVDYVASLLMKYNYKEIPTIFNGFENEYWNLVYKKSSEIVYSGNEDLEKVRKYFVPTFGWQKKLKEKQ